MYKSTPEETKEGPEGGTGNGCCPAAAPEASAEVEKLQVTHWLHKGCSSLAPASTSFSSLKKIVKKFFYLQFLSCVFLSIAYAGCTLEAVIRENSQFVLINLELL